MIKQILFGMVLALLFAVSTQAATDCPFGLTNDPAPGSCARFVDADNDNYCDLSQAPLSRNYGVADKGEVPYLSEEEMKSMTVKEAAEAYGIETGAFRAALSEYLKIDVKGGDTLQSLHDDYGLCTGVAANIALSVKNNQDLDDVAEHDLVSGEEIKAMKVYEVAELYGIDQNAYANALASVLGVKVALTKTIGEYHDNNGLEASKAKELAKELAGDSAAQSEPPLDAAPKAAVKTTRYKFLPIAAVTLVLYLATLAMSRKKIITPLQHKRVWNMVLLLSFLASSALALFLITRINWGWAPDLPFNMLYWHVETGTVMLVISIFHIIEHYRFYTCMFRRKNAECGK